MFGTLTMAPPDAILGLTEAYNRDSNPDKINLGVGVYKDEAGQTPVLACVKAAERRLLENETSKSYRPITGDARYGELVQTMLFGDGHPVLTDKRCVSAHSPGGTGALRVVGDYLTKLGRRPTVWLPTPTWANHRAIFTAAGLTVDQLPYFDAKSNALDYSALCAKLDTLPEGDAVLLHGCCHNPTGVDPSLSEWEGLAERLAARKLLPIVDFAYQGLGDGLGEDAEGLRIIAGKVPELVVCSSFSKNFGLYNERTGAVSIVAEDQATAEVVLSNVKVCIRSNYSNPPAHGASIVRTVLEDPTLARQWDGELGEMRQRINGMRELFVETLTNKRAPIDCSFIMRQRGMFSMLSGISKEQVHALRERFSIYIVDSARINVAGITSANVERLADAIVAVL